MGNITSLENLDRRHESSLSGFKSKQRDESSFIVEDQSDRTLNYDRTICTRRDISLEDSLRLTYKPFLGDMDVPLEIRIFPYCNEVVVASEMFDKVNRSKVRISDLETLKSVFRVQIIEITDTITTTEKHVVAPKSDADMFFEFILDHFNQMDHLNRVFIVSHGKFIQNFMKKLEKYVAFILPNNYPALDNLDILYIKFVHNLSHIGNEMQIGIMRYPNYEMEKLTMDTHPAPSSVEKHVYLMRPCVACHNHPDTTSMDKFKYSFSGITSLCLRNINEEMEVALQRIYNILNEHAAGGCLHVGSSIVFRAILTTVLISLALFKRSPGDFRIMTLGTQKRQRRVKATSSRRVLYFRSRSSESRGR